MPEANQVYTPPHTNTSGKSALAIQATVDRLKQIAGDAMDHLILSDGPPQPDYALLDLCGDLLHLLKHANAAREACRNMSYRDPKKDEARDEARALDGQISSLTSKARKLRATTAAGIYAKALVMRASPTGMPQLATSLAEDLVSSPNLRASIWPNEGGVA